MSGKARRPTLACLEALLLFAEKKEAKATAKQLHRTESVVSRKLSELRTRYGLLHKQGNQQRLTRRGEEAVVAIRALLRQYDQLAEWLAGRQTSPQAIVVAAGSLTSQLDLPRALALFAQKQPGWQVQVQVRRGRERIIGTANGTFDLAVVSHDPSQIQAVLQAQFGEEARLAMEELGRDWLCVIARKGTAAGRQLGESLESQAIDLSRLADYELIGLDAQSGIRKQLERGAGRPLRFRVEAGGWAAARECARQGLGAAVVPLSLLSFDDRQELEVRRLGGDIGAKDFLIYRREASHAALEALRSALRRAVAGRQQELRTRWGGVLPL
jgi:DNA-binding transcriptional LysR family regulator